MVEKSELVAQDIWDRIPEEDKVCINCEHFGSRMNEGGTDKCHGAMPCCNYSAEWEDNYFTPDESYVLDMFGCDACVYYSGGDCSEECGSCNRYYELKWTMRYV